MAGGKNMDVDIPPPLIEEPEKTSPHRDPALDPINGDYNTEHNNTEKGQVADDVVYSTKNAFEKSGIAEPKHHDMEGNTTSNSDGEDPGQGSAKRPWHRRVVHYKPLVHGIIWLLFTG
jgi:hypothetical protein